MRFTFRLLAAVAAAALSVSAASAVPITSTDGNAGPGSFSTIGTAANGSFIMTWAPPGAGAGQSATTIINQSLVSAIPTYLANMQFTRTPTSVGNGTQYAFENFIFGITFQVQQTGTETVDFSFDNLVATVPNSNLNTLIIDGDLTFLGNNTNPLLDFSPYQQNGGRFTITFNTAPGTNLNNVIQNGASFFGTASFSTVANADATTPEPASMVVFGVLALGGLAVARRKLFAKSVASA